MEICPLKNVCISDGSLLCMFFVLVWSLHLLEKKVLIKFDFWFLAAVEIVEPTNSYYEKMSEELEKIVHEVKDSPADDNGTQITDQKGGNGECYYNRLFEWCKRGGLNITYRTTQTSIGFSWLCLNVWITTE